MKCITSKHQHLSLYLDDEILLVWSHSTYRLYGFKGSEAGLFFALEEGLSMPHTPLSQKIIEILNNNETKEEEKKEIIPSHFSPTLVLDTHRDFYCMEGWYFFITSNHQEIEQKVQEALAHLRTTISPKEAIEIKISLDESHYLISIHDKVLHRLSKLEYIVPILQDTIRLIYYKNNPYLMVIHAGALEYNAKVLLLIGVSGSGKSTLCAFLMQKGFNLFSDELSVISQKEELVPLPLGLSIKEGSWQSLEASYPQLKKLPSHRRFDDQKVKSLLSTSYAQKRVSLKNGYIIFPTYTANAPTRLQEIDIIETLHHIAQSQYDISNPKSRVLLEQWLMLLSSCKCYTLTYSDMEEAEEIVKEIMHPSQFG